MDVSLFTVDCTGSWVFVCGAHGLFSSPGGCLVIADGEVGVIFASMPLLQCEGEKHGCGLQILDFIGAHKSQSSTTSTST